MLLSYLHSESSRWRTERMLLWLTRYTSRCFSFPLVLFLFPVPDFCNLTTSPPTSPLHPPSSPPHSFESIPKLYNQECTCVCVCVFQRGVYPGLLPSPIHWETPRWLTGRGECGSTACCHMRKSAYTQCLWTKTGKYRHRKISSVFTGEWEPSALSFRRGLLCSVFQCFVIAILILNYNCGWQGRVLTRGTLAWCLENSPSGKEKRKRKRECLCVCECVCVRVYVGVRTLVFRLLNQVQTIHAYQVCQSMCLFLL